MIFLYNVLWLLALPGILLYLSLRRLFTGKYRQNLGQRFGLGLERRENAGSQEVIWVHALSVGEVLSAIPLIRSLRQEFPDFDIFVSTTTESGQQVARQKLDSLNCYFLYFPLDLYWVVHRAVKLIGATLFVLVETDLWPNLLWCLAKQRTPVVLVNGRLSDRSFPRYRLLRRFFGGVLSNVNTFCMQSQEDARRLRLLGIERAKIQVTGNLKFDQPLKKTVSHERNQLMSELGWTPPSLTWIAGSTHPGEEAIILRTYGRLRQRFADLCLILAPRNQERFTEVFQLAEQAGWKTVRRSQFPAGKPAAGAMDVLILDTIGELARFYSLGNCAFLGGSLVPFGGHNPLEAAQRGLPVVFGPHMENFREIAAILQESGGGFQVADENGLFKRVEAWLAAPETGREQGKNAQEAVLIHQGALARSLEVIRSMLGAGKVS